MKAIKIYLIIISVLLVIALGFAVYVWHKLQVIDSYSQQSPDTALEATDVGVNTPVKTVPEEGDIVISGDQLTTDQKATLETFGFDSENIVITEAMIACAREELGAERVAEISAGAAPGPLESLKLLGCVE